MAVPQQAPQQSPQALNMQQRQLVLGHSVEMIQSISNQTVFPTSNPVLNILPRNVGLIKKFIVEVTATLTNGAGGVATLTDTGISNILSNIQFTDLNNNVRINTEGLHLGLLASAKRRHPYVATADWNTATGNNRGQAVNVPSAAWGVFQAPPTIAASTAGTVRVVYEIPLAYSDDDLRGAVYANVINATMNLQLTFNNSAMVGAAPADYTNAVYQGSTGTFTSATVNVYQVYLDQLPVGKNGVILPILDLSTIYEMKSTNFTAISANNDFPVPYANFRDFLSTYAIFNNQNTATGRTFGTDVNYWSLQSANFTNLWKIDPLLAAQLSREVIQADLPAGVYYFSSRRKPINTTQYGNMQLNLNATSSVNGNGYLKIYWEDMALVNTLTNAGSLAG